MEMNEKKIEQNPFNHYVFWIIMFDYIKFKNLIINFCFFFIFKKFYCSQLKKSFAFFN